MNTQESLKALRAIYNGILENKTPEETLVQFQQLRVNLTQFIPGLRRYDLKKEGWGASGELIVYLDPGQKRIPTVDREFYTIFTSWLRLDNSEVSPVRQVEFKFPFSEKTIFAAGKVTDVIFELEVTFNPNRSSPTADHTVTTNRQETIMIRTDQPFPAIARTAATAMLAHLKWLEENKLQ